MLDTRELIAGPAFVSIDGLDMGFTTADGITYSPEFETTEFESAQTQMVVAAHRSKIRAVLSATFNQLSLEKWRILEDMADAPVGNTLVARWDDCGPKEHNIVLTMPGPNCSTRTLTARGVIITPGEKVFSNAEYTGAPVEILLLGDATNNSLFTVVETPSTVDAPAAASYQYLTDATTEVAFVDGGTVPDDAIALQVTFNVPIRSDQLNSSRIMLLADGEIVAASYEYGKTGTAPNYNKVRIVPAVALASATPHSIIVVPRILSMSGKGGEGDTVNFVTSA